MAEPFIAEIKLIAWNFPPRGWAFCNGQLLPINQNQALFALLGTTYGGNGQTTFALPNLQARVPVHFGAGGGGTYALGQVGGESTHTLSVAEIPAHTHTVSAGSGAPDRGSPAANFCAANPGAYAAGSNAALAAAAVASAGGSQPHENEPPYLVINMCIALVGIFPSQT
jgi:microcystin-dependent protein